MLSGSCLAGMNESGVITLEREFEMEQESINVYRLFASRRMLVWMKWGTKLGFPAWMDTRLGEVCRVAEAVWIDEHKIFIEV